MNCIHCGKQIENGLTFCPLCGGKLGAGSGQPQYQQPVQPQYQQPVQPQPQPQQQPVQPQQQYQYQQPVHVVVQQQKSEAEFVTDLKEIFAGIFSNPAETLKNTVKKANLLLAAAFIVVQSLFSGFMLMGIAKGIAGSANSALGLLSYVDFPYGKLFLFGLLAGLGIDALMALFAFVFLGAVFKKDVTFQSALSAVGLKALGNTPFLLLACLGGILKPWIGVAFGVAGMVLGYVYMYSAVLPENSGEEPVYGKFLSAVCGVASSYLWIYILLKMFS